MMFTQNKWKPFEPDWLTLLSFTCVAHLKLPCVQIFCNVLFIRKHAEWISKLWAKPLLGLPVYRKKDRFGVLAPSEPPKIYKTGSTYGALMDIFICCSIKQEAPDGANYI